MYTVEYYDKNIYIPGDNDFIAESPTLSLEANKVGTLTFAILDTHPYFGELEKLRIGIVVKEDGKTIFRGRVIDSEQNFDNIYDVTVEGKLAVLNDSPCRPYAFEGTPEELFEWFVENHNAQVSDEQKLLKGNVTVTDPNNYINRSWENADTTWNLTNSRLLDTLGGYFVVRYESDGDYLDWLEGFSSYSTQEIRFGENLLDITCFIDAAKTYTACIPYGAEIQDITYEEVDAETAEWEEGRYYTLSGDTYVLINTQSEFESDISAGMQIYEIGSQESTGERLTINSVNDEKDYLINQSMADQYGVIYAPSSETTWDDVTRPENLKKKALDWLNNEGVTLQNTIELSSLDLARLGADVGAIGMYQNVRVVSEPHNIEESYLVEKMTLKLDAPEDMQIKLGGSKQSLTDKNLGEKKRNDKVIEKVENIESDYTTNEQVKDVVTRELITASSEILQTAEEIIMGVMAGYTTSADLEEYKRQIENLLKVNEEGFSFEFNQMERRLTEMGNEIVERNQFIRLINGEIIIGKSDSPYTSVYTNDSLEFRYNNEMVARFAAGVLEVRNIAVQNQISYFGQWATRPGDYVSGRGYNLDDVWLGG